MSGKDPKDMTASELLRWAANGEPYNNGTDENNWRHPVGKIGALIEAVTGEWPSEHRVFNSLADKIDAEIEEARRDAVKESKNPMRWFRSAIRQGEDWPEPRDGEKFRDYLKRCFIQRPLDEDGEPVQFGDNDIDWGYTDECRVPGALFNATAVDVRGKILATTFNNIVAVAKTDENGRVKRNAPEVLGADGLPIVEGDVVYELGRDDALTVCEVNAQYIHAKKESGAAWNNLTAEYLTHTPPDTQERIYSDAVSSSFAKYWGCSGIGCDECPASIDGKLPDERYGTSGCREAMILDLLRRQRELDKRMGGE